MKTALDPQLLSEEYEAYKLRESKSYSGPSQANRCSVLGHPCVAYCYYDRTVDSASRVQISAHLAGIFQEGHDQERNFHRDLLQMGWTIQESQGSLAWKKYNITGHRDFVLGRNGVSVRCEFKSVHPLLWNKLNTPQDVKDHRAYFIRKWYAQVILYCLLDGQEAYWLVLKNKSTGQIKVITFEWNDETLQDAEELLKKAEKVNGLVQLGREIPVELKIADEDICGGCEFLTICNPPLDFGPGVDVLDEETAAELSALADRRAHLEPAADEFEDVDDELKGRVKAWAGSEKTQLVFGNWLAKIQRQNVAAEKKPRSAFTKTIVKLVRLVVGEPQVKP